MLKGVLMHYQNYFTNLVLKSNAKKVGMTTCLIFLILISLLGSGCVKQAESKDPLVVEDMVGRKVGIPNNVDDIVALGAGTLRLVDYLNSTDKIVGVEEIEKKEKHLKGRPYILANPELSNLPSVGPKHGGDPELIAAQDPDIIFWSGCTVGEAKDLQSKIDVPVVVIEYGDLGAHRDTLFDGLRILGTILDKENRANNVIQFMKEKIKDLENRTENVSSKERPVAYVGGVNYHGSHGLVGTEPKFAPFQFVNAKNPAVNLGMEHVLVSKEKIIEWNPDFIFIDEGSYSMVMKDLKDQKFKELNAIREDNVYGILPQSYYSHNFGNVLANSYFIGSVLYPKRFSDIDPEDKADDIYMKLVGSSVYDEMKKDFGGFKEINIAE